MGVVQDGIVRLQRWMQLFTPSLNKVVLFFLILFIGFLVGKIVGRLLRKLLADLKADAALRRVTGGRLSIEKGASGLAALLIYLVSVIIALNAVGLTATVLEIILAVLMLAIVLSALLALKDVIPNLVQGLSLRGKLREGDTIRLEGAEGAVAAIGLLETTVTTKNGDTVIVPNALFARTSVRVRRRRARPGGEQ